MSCFITQRRCAKAVKILAVKTLVLGMTGAAFTAFFLKLNKKEFMACILISLLLVCHIRFGLYIL